MKAAVIGGVGAGILSAITSVIPVISCCCCLLALGGGVFTVFLYTKETKLPVTPAEGAKLAAVAGGIAAAIYFVINLVLGLLVGSAAMAAQMAQMEQQSGVSIPLSGVALQFVGSLVGAIGVAILTVLGGVLGAAIFGKDKGPSAPPPPPPSAAGPGGYGTPGGGGGGGGYGQPGGSYGQNP